MNRGLFAALVAALMAGCGGGGSSSGSPGGPAGSVSGRLVDSLRQSVSGAQVTAEGTNAAAATAPDGSFSLPLPPGDYRVRARKGGVTLVDVPAAVAAAGEDADLGLLAPLFWHEDRAPAVPKVQMHLHGLSHHNGVFKNASMQWHSAWAHQTNAADVLWWTDHDAIFDQTVDVDVVPSAGTLDPSTLEVTFPPVPNGRISGLEASASGGTPSAELTAGGLRASLRSGPGTEWGWLSYRPVGPNFGGAISWTQWSRPLTSAPVLEAELDFDPSDPDAACEVAVDLSWHYHGDQFPHRLRFRFTPPSEAGTDRVGRDTVEVRVPATAGTAVYALDLLAAAAALPEGEDNALVNVAFRVGARRGQTGTATLRRLTLRSLRPEAAHQIERFGALAHGYEGLYRSIQHVGLEYANVRADPVHLNGFFPGDLPGPAFLERADTAQEWVDRVHAAGGLVSYNHPFGFENQGPGGSAGEDLSQRVRERAETLLANRLHGADYIEAGYLARGRADLRAHLRLWDVLVANGLRVYGNGTTDSHGDPWGPAMGPNPFATWLQADGLEPQPLLEALRRGRAAFGNPFHWDGLFTLRVGGAAMGGDTTVDSAELPVEVRFTPWLDTIRLFLVQGVLQPGLDVEYLHDRTELPRGRTVFVETTRPTFVRLEAYRFASDDPPEGEPVAFTNPVWLLR